MKSIEYSHVNDIPLSRSRLWFTQRFLPYRFFSSCNVIPIQNEFSAFYLIVRLQTDNFKHKRNLLLMKVQYTSPPTSSNDYCFLRSFCNFWHPCHKYKASFAPENCFEVHKAGEYPEKKNINTQRI